MSFSITHAPRLSPQPDPEAGCPGRMTHLHRARWNLAVLEELAQPGQMALAPVWGDAGDVIDFIWREASPTATLAFGCAGEDWVGRMLKQVLVECAMDASLFARYRTAFLQARAEVFRVDGKEGVTVHSVSPLPASLSVEVTCVAAMDRLLAAQRAVLAMA